MIDAQAKQQAKQLYHHLYSGHAQYGRLSPEIWSRKVTLENGEVEPLPMNKADKLLAHRQAMENGGQAMKLFRLSQKMIRAHLAGDETVYFTNHRPKAVGDVHDIYTLVCIDIDAKKQGMTEAGADLLARRISDELFHGNCHIEPSTSGRGRHVYFVGMVEPVTFWSLHATKKQAMLDSIGCWPLAWKQTVDDAGQERWEPSDNLNRMTSAKLNSVYSCIMQNLAQWGATITQAAEVDHRFCGSYPVWHRDAQGDIVDLTCPQVIKLPRHAFAPDSRFFELTPVSTLDLLVKLDELVPNVQHDIMPAATVLKQSGNVSTMAGASPARRVRVLHFANDNTQGEAELAAAVTAGRFKYDDAAALARWADHRTSSDSLKRKRGVWYEMLWQLGVKDVTDFPSVGMVRALYELKYDHTDDDAHNRADDLRRAGQFVMATFDVNRVSRSTAKVVSELCDSDLFNYVLNRVTSLDIPQCRANFDKSIPACRFNVINFNHVAKITTLPNTPCHIEDDINDVVISGVSQHVDVGQDMIPAGLQTGGCRLVENGKVVENIYTNNMCAPTDLKVVKYGKYWLTAGQLWTALSVMLEYDGLPLAEVTLSGIAGDLMTRHSIGGVMNKKRSGQAVDVLLRAGVLQVVAEYSTGCKGKGMKGRSYEVMICRH